MPSNMPVTKSCIFIAFACLLTMIFCCITWETGRSEVGQMYLKKPSHFLCYGLCNHKLRTEEPIGYL